jgi:ABC-type transporter Mla subunit MlaD
MSPPSPIGDNEYHDTTEYTVNNKEEGELYLTCHLLSIPDCPMDLHNVSATLHQIIHLRAMPLPAKEALRAIAYILEDHAVSEIATSIIPHLVTPTTEKLTNEVIKAIAPYIADLLRTSQSVTTATNMLKTNHTSLTEITHSLHDHLDLLKNQPKQDDPNLNPHASALNIDITDIKEAVSKIPPTIDLSRKAIITYFDSDLAEIKEAVEKLTPNLAQTDHGLKDAIEATKSSLNDIIEHSKLLDHNLPPQDGPHPTYSNTLKSLPPNTNTHADTPPQATPAIARAAVRDRQVLIQPTGLDPIFDPSHTSEAIALRVESAINALDNPDNLEVEIIAILHLNSGSLLLELNSKEATNWI